MSDQFDLDALSDDLEPFDLLDCALSAYAESDSTAFMGPSWCSFKVYKIKEGEYIVIEDQVEIGEYIILNSASSLDGAAIVVREAATDRLGEGCRIDI